jgi:hypothetical protein
MYPKLRLEKISDLFLCIFYISLAFLCKISFFLFAFTVFAVLASFRSMNEQKSRVTVFYKRKNIPGIILMIYLSFLFIILILITWFQYFGKDSFSYFIRETWDVVIHLLPIFVVLKAGDYLIRSEKELNALGTRLIVGTIILVAVVLSFRSQYESLDYLEKQRSEILSLQKRGKIQGNQNIYGSNLLSDYVYFYGGFAVRFREGSVQKPDDLFVISNIDPSVRQYLDKSHLKGQYFPVNGSTILITREASDTILFQEGKNILKSRLTQFLSGLPLVKPSPHQKFCSYLGENFGFEVSAN